MTIRHTSQVQRARAILGRMHILLHSLAIVSLMYYRFSTIFTTPNIGLSWVLVTLAELVLTFLWSMTQGFRWRPVLRSVVGPEELKEAELPGLDVFICTADPKKEPVLEVMNSVISAMALDYPPSKLAVYLSDDGGSPFTRRATKEACEFGKVWLPFCRKYRIKTRCPEAFFSSSCDDERREYWNAEFIENMLVVKSKYKALKSFVETSEDATVVNDRGPYVETMHDNKQNGENEMEMPLVVYLAREKRPGLPHHFKAGALNALLRVSSLLSNGPFLLVLDCDMYCNDPTSARQSMCFLLDPKMAPSLAFVQYPQIFYNTSKNDIYDGQARSAFKGSKIQATVKKALRWKFENYLKEGEMRFITTFGVGENGGEYRNTQHPYKINFYKTTTVKECTGITIPLHGFNFTPFNEIISLNVDANYLIDVIGHVTAYGEIEQSQSKKPYMKLELLDLNNQALSCTLWQSYAEEMHKYISNFTNNNADKRDPIIIIIHLAKVKNIKGASISNSLFATKILTNADIPEIQDFRNKMSPNGESSTSQMLTQISSQSTIESEFLQMSARKTLDELREVEEEGGFVTLASIVCIQTDDNWFYNACGTCRCKVTINDDGDLTCGTAKCAKEVPIVVPRYKLKVKVVDSTGNASFVLFDKHVTEVLHISAKQLRDFQLKIDDVDQDSFPDEFDKFVGRKFLFKIKVTKDFNIDKGWDSYGVLRMTDDATIIEKFVNATKSPEESGEDEYPRDIVNLTEEGEKDSNSCICDTDPPSTITPTKRSLQAVTDDSETQLSTSKQHVRVKIEKNSD